MNTTKYHKEVGFENQAIEHIVAEILNSVAPLDEQIDYTLHAKLETIKDRYQIVPVLTKNNLKKEDIIEYTKENGKIVKALFRIKNLSNRFDFTYSVSLDGKVLTCWANRKDDVHRTLDKNKYERVTK